MLSLLLGTRESCKERDNLGEKYIVSPVSYTNFEKLETCWYRAALIMTSCAFCMNLHTHKTNQNLESLFEWIVTSSFVVDKNFPGFRRTGTVHGNGLLFVQEVG